MEKRRNEKRKIGRKIKDKTKVFMLGQEGH